MDEEGELLNREIFEILLEVKVVAEHRKTEYNTVMNITPDKKNIKKILLIRFSCIGDVLLTTPVVATVRKHFPKAHITYLTERLPGEALVNNPHINKILIFEKGIVKKIVGEKQYDLVINFDWYPSSQAICFLSRAKYRIGIPAIKEAGHKLEVCEPYNVTPIKFSRKPDIIDQFLNLTRSLGLKDYTRDTGFYLTDQERDFAGAYIKRHKLGGGLIIGVHPGGHRKEELWPTQKFAELINRAIEKFSANVLIFTGPGEEDSVIDVYDNIKQKYKVLIVPKFSLRKYASLIKKCDIFIAHDRGPMHIAASLGVKTIGIFTTPYAKEWFPYKDKKYCAYFEKKRARFISINDVFKKVFDFAKL